MLPSVKSHRMVLTSESVLLGLPPTPHIRKLAEMRSRSVLPRLRAVFVANWLGMFGHRLKIQLLFLWGGQNWTPISSGWSAMARRI